MHNSLDEFLMNTAKSKVKLVSNDEDKSVPMGLYPPSDLFDTISLLYAWGLREFPLLSPCVGDTVK